MASPIASVVGMDGLSNLFFVDSQNRLERWVILEEPEKPPAGRSAYSSQIIQTPVPKSNPPKAVPVKVSAGSAALAAVAYQWGNPSNASIRVFYLDDNNALQELCKDIASGGQETDWKIGSINKLGIVVDKTLPISALANTQGPKPQLKVYYYLSKAKAGDVPSIAYTNLGDGEVWLKGKLGTA